MRISLAKETIFHSSVEGDDQEDVDDHEDVDNREDVDDREDGEGEDSECSGKGKENDRTNSSNKNFIAHFRYFSIPCMNKFKSPIDNFLIFTEESFAYCQICFI